MRHLRVPLEAVEGLLAVAEGGDGRRVGVGEDLEVEWETVDGVAVAHPDPLPRPHPLEDALRRIDDRLPGTVLHDLSFPHIAAVEVCEELVAVAEAEDGDA